MPQKESIEFIAKVDDSNQVVPRDSVPTPDVSQPSPIAPQPVDVGEGLSNLEEASQQQLDELIHSSAQREATLRVLRELQQEIANLSAAGGGGDDLPPDEPPTTNFFDDEDNRFDNIPDLTEETEKLQEAFEDLIDSFDKVDTGPTRDPSFDDELTEEFDKQFENPFNKDDVDELTESFDAQLLAMNRSTLTLGKFAGGIGLAVTALSGFVVGAQLYSSVLANVIENFGEFSDEVKEAQAETEIARVQQQIQFSDRLEDILAETERSRNEVRGWIREFLAALIELFGPFANLINELIIFLFQTLTNLVNNLQAGMRGLLFLVEIATTSLKVLNAFYNFVTFQWFKSDDNTSNTDVWDDITAPENVIPGIPEVKRRNVNGRDEMDIDDLLRKNLR